MSILEEKVMKKSAVEYTNASASIGPPVLLLLYNGLFQKISSQTCASRMLSFSPEVVPIGWTLIQNRNFFARPASTLTMRPKEAAGNFALHKMLFFWSHLGFGLTVRVEAGQAKKILS